MVSSSSSLSRRGRAASGRRTERASHEGSRAHGALMQACLPFLGAHFTRHNFNRRPERVGHHRHEASGANPAAPALSERGMGDLGKLHANAGTTRPRVCFRARDGWVKFSDVVCFHAITLFSITTVHHVPTIPAHTSYTGILGFTRRRWHNRQTSRYDILPPA